MSAPQPPTAATLSPAARQRAHTVSFVTARLGTHWFALPIADVWEVFPLRRVAPVPLAPASVRGLMNLRGRIVTVLDTAALLDLPRMEPCDTAIGIDAGGELYGLAVAAVGDVLCVDAELCEPPPPNLAPQWRSSVRAVYRHDDRLVMIVDVAGLLEEGSAVANATTPA